MGVIIRNGIMYGGSSEQQQSDWNVQNPSSGAFIRNKPVLGSAASCDVDEFLTTDEYEETSDEDIEDLFS